MEEKTTPLEVLMERTQAYTRTSIQLFKFKVTEKLAAMFSNMASGVIVVAVLTLVFVNLNIGIALLVGDLLGKAWLGFMAVAAFYAIVGWIVYLFRERWIKGPVSDSIIHQLLSDELSDEDKLPE